MENRNSPRTSLRVRLPGTPALVFVHSVVIDHSEPWICRSKNSASGQPRCVKGLEAHVLLLDVISALHLYTMAILGR